MGDPRELPQPSDELDKELTPQESQVSAVGEVAGDVLGNYRLLNKIGEGGMGTVWRAQQSEPIQREVALKIIKLGMDTKEVVARFEVERQALAIMDHPFIAKVFDGGATQLGRPYFVMELVPGIPITKFANQKRLSLRERLGLFVQVCDAIQHAHHKGIIHRDIKPSNILVASHTGGLEPRIIDFGIAKATSSNLAERTMLTHTSQSVGSPEYMAPEQTELSGLDVDTRADVYALGVVLYELLAGLRPFNMRRILEDGHDEMLRTIREVDPEPPSARLLSHQESAGAIAAARGLSVEGLHRTLLGDLDWITMKALEKERSRRYQSARDFAADVQRYLSYQAVLAAPSSLGYRIRKFVKRRRNTFIAALAAGLLFLTGAIGTGYNWWKTNQANAKLEQSLIEKELLRKEAESNEAKANVARAKEQRHAEVLQRVVDFQSKQLGQLDLRKMGFGIRRELIAGAPESRQELLHETTEGLNFTNLALETLRQNHFQQTLKAIDAQFEDEPELRAQLLHSTSQTLNGLGILDLAIESERRALELWRQHHAVLHEDTLKSLNHMGDMLLHGGQLAEAEPYIREALQGCQTLLGERHERTLDVQGTLATLLFRQGQPSAAVTLLREVLEGCRASLRPGHPMTILALSNLASMNFSLRKYELALSELREAVELCRLHLGDLAPETLGNINNLGVMLFGLGRYDEAESYYREALAVKRETLGDDHSSTLKSLQNLGALLKELGRLEEAEACFVETIERSRRALSNPHTDTLNALNNMGALLLGQDRFLEAEVYLREASEGRAQLLGATHSDTLESAVNWGTAASRVLLQAREGEARVTLPVALERMGAQKLLLGKAEEAELLFGEAVELLETHGSSEAWQVLSVRGRLGLALAGQGRYGEAEALLLECAQGLLELSPGPHPGPGSLATERLLGDLVRYYRARDEVAPAPGLNEQARAWEARLSAWLGS